MVCVVVVVVCVWWCVCVWWWCVHVVVVVMVHVVVWCGGAHACVVVHMHVSWCTHVHGGACACAVVHQRSVVRACSVLCTRICAGACECRYMCTCAFACMCVHVRACACMCVHVRACACVRACVYMYIYVLLYFIFLYIREEHAGVTWHSSVYRHALTQRGAGLFSKPKDKSRNEVGTYWEDSPWPSRGSTVFTLLNTFMERCNDLLELLGATQQFSKLRVASDGGGAGDKTSDAQTFEIQTAFDDSLMTFNKKVKV